LLALLLILAPTAFLVGGCWDLRELDDWAFVSMMGLDKGAQPGWVRLSVLVQLPGSVSGAGGRPVPAFARLTSEGPTLFDADRRLEELTGDFLTYTHAQVVVVGEELAREGLGALVDSFKRSRELHHTIIIAVADGVTAEEVLESARGDIDPFPATYLSHLVEKTQAESGESSRSIIHCVLVAEAAHGQEIVLALIKLAHKPAPPSPSGSGTGSGGGSAGGKSGGGEAGAGAPEQAAPVERRVEATGLALFRGLRLAVKITGEQAMALNLVRGQFEQGRVVVNGAATGGKDLSVALSHYEREVKLERNGPSIEVKLKVRLDGLAEDASAAGVDLTPEGSGAIKELVGSKLSEMMSGIITLAQTQVGGDVFAFQLHGRATFRTWPEWMAYDWDRAFREAKVSVEVEVMEIHPGLAVQTQEYGP
jgi:spore germination protein KC